MKKNSPQGILFHILMTRYNQFSPYFLCRVSWLPIIINLGSLSQIRLNEYQLKSISFNYNICGIWKIFNNTRQRRYGLREYNLLLPAGLRYGLREYNLLLPAGLRYGLREYNLLLPAGLRYGLREYNLLLSAGLRIGGFL